MRTSSGVSTHQLSIILNIVETDWEIVWKEFELLEPGKTVGYDVIIYYIMCHVILLHVIIYYMKLHDLEPFMPWGFVGHSYMCF